MSEDNKKTHRVVGATIIRLVWTCYTSELHNDSIARFFKNNKDFLRPHAAEKGQCHAQNNIR